MLRYRSNRGWPLGQTKISPEFGLWKANTSSTLRLAGDTLVAGGILIFQTWHLKLYVTVKGNIFQAWENYSLFMRGFASKENTL